MLIGVLVLSLALLGLAAMFPVVVRTQRIARDTVVGTGVLASPARPGKASTGVPLIKGRARGAGTGVPLMLARPRSVSTGVPLMLARPGGAGTGVLLIKGRARGVGTGVPEARGRAGEAGTGVFPGSGQRPAGQHPAPVPHEQAGGLPADEREAACLKGQLYPRTPASDAEPPARQHRQAAPAPGTSDPTPAPPAQRGNGEHPRQPGGGGLGHCDPRPGVDARTADVRRIVHDGQLPLRHAQP